ncbi:MAG: extracellular elastinolytic metalloproteinase [Actinomycetota bacterium]|jgi:hypothetical protein|nr:extracellular elastinolytic metalloproteinase [Actinomycetota bacterium]
MRRVISIALVLGLLGAMSASPAFAKKKKPVPPPITFEASGSFVLGSPLGLNDATITGNEFTNTCAIPASQGVDGFVVELSDEISKVTSAVQVSGSDSTGIYDLDMYFYTADCSSTGSASTEAADELGAFPAGTKYVLVNAFFGAQVEFTLKATEVRS